MADTQRPSGQFPGIVPSGGWGYNWGSGPAWDNAFILIPWYIYLHTGSTELIERHYDRMTLYMKFCASMATDHILSFGLGDWCPAKTKTPHALTSTGYYYADACILAKCAMLLERDNDAKRFEAFASEIKTAFNQRFYKGKGVYANGEMTAMGCALYQGLVDDAEIPAVVSSLVKAVRDNDHKADFGILGAKYIPRALADNGEAETAYKLITQDACPGWVHWLRQGSTTLWETWNGGASLNHIMFGDVSAWMFNYLAGIQPDEEHPGFSFVTIRPTVIEDLEWVHASHKAPAGMIKSAWQRTGGNIEFSIELPAGIQGALILPDGKCTNLEPGSNHTQHTLAS
jgi:alpha-L-rhamnosidase